MNQKDFVAKHILFLKNHKYVPDWPWFYSRIIGKHKLGEFVWFLETIKNYPIPEQILDLAGGLGMYGAYMQKVIGWKFKYVICDLPIMKYYSRKYLELFNIKREFVVCNVRNKLNIKSNSVDMVWFFGWSQFENINHKTVFSEIYRVLKQNGTAMFDIINVAAPVSIRRDKLRQILEKIGFIIKIFKKDTDYGLKTFSVIVKNT